MSISLIVLSSTRQHHGLVDCDIISITDLLKKSSIIRNSPKYYHLKTIPGDESIAGEKKKWFEDKGFNVFETVAHWENDKPSHGSELVKDMAKMYSLPEVLDTEYVLNFENDWIMNVENADPLIEESCNILALKPEIIYHRHSRVDNTDLPIRLDAKMEIMRGDFRKCVYKCSREFSFNPFIARARDMRYIAPFVYRNYGQLHPHCEMAYELAAKYLFGKDDIFSFTDSQVVEHIGWPHTYEKFIKGQK